MKWMALAAIVFVLGCDKPAPQVGGAKVFRVAMILPGSDQDHGWNQMAREGLDRIRDELKAQTKIVTNVKTGEMANQLSYFGGEGFDVVFCHGQEFASDVGKAAGRFPKTHFIVGGCPTDIPGAVAVEFQARDASNLAGSLAAQVSRTKTAAFVGAMEIPTLVACYEGMRDGIAAAKTQPPVKLLPPLWTDSWDSPTRAKEKAEAALGAGADVIFQNVDSAAQGVFEAVRAASKPSKPAFAIGCNSNQNPLAPDVIVGSVVIDVQRAYLDLTRRAQAGELKSGAIKLGLEGAYVDLVLNEAHPVITPPLKQNLADLRRALLVANRQK
ncbi:MAG TPA: BMP family protein [Tepidisphaeraceae bacterium]|jgi:basic membrane lipoprotein Med (substrate-binding protein (PBP1-ABC) superfamily)|nr:BMP family protein [Tepidisphaeraceae bacterium]